SASEPGDQQRDLLRPWQKGPPGWRDMKNCSWFFLSGGCYGAIRVIAAEAQAPDGARFLAFQSRLATAGASSATPSAASPSLPGVTSSTEPCIVISTLSLQFSMHGSAEKSVYS